MLSRWLFGSSWQVVAVSHSPPRKPLFRYLTQPLRIDLFPKSLLGKNCRYGGTIEVALPELVGEGNCGAGIMLLLAITTRRVNA
jgi:hypothetical protein